MENSEVSSLILFSVFPAKQRWLAFVLMCCYPKFASYVSTLYNMLYRRRYPDYSSIVLKKKDSEKDNDDNFSYNAVNWFCTTYHLKDQTNLLSKTYTYKYNEKISGNAKRVPIYLPSTATKIEYQGKTIQVNFDTDAESVRLESTQLEVINNFIMHAIDLCMNYRYNNMDPEKIYTCEWKKDDYISIIMNTNKTYDNVYLPDALMNGIVADISKFKANEEMYRNDGIPYKRGYLFYGPPGTGKTSTVYAIARENNMNLYKINCSTFSDDCFKQQMRKIPRDSVVLIEEIDTQVTNDRSESTVEKGSIIPSKKVTPLMTSKVNLSVLMEILDGYDYLHGCIIILTTNHKECLDKALIRPGRVDMHYHFDILTAPDIHRTTERFSGFDIQVPDGLTMTSSTLINQILLPNRIDQATVQHLIDSVSDEFQINSE